VKHVQAQLHRLWAAAARALLPAAACLLMLFAAGGCASPPDFEPPELDIDVPDEWTAAVESGAGESGLAEDWWKAFGDAGLDSAVSAALERSRDLRAAAARIDQAAAAAEITGADSLPDLNLNLNGSRRRNNYIGLPIPGSDEEVLSNTTTTHGLSLDLTWEIDLWGRLRSAEKAAAADWQAAAVDFHAARLSIAGQVVKAWFAIAEAKQQVALADATVTSFRTSADQVAARYEGGLTQPLDLRLALSNLADAEALQEARLRQLDAAERRLEIILDRYPGRNMETPSLLPDVPAPVPAGLPAHLVARRPDLAAAERRLVAADYRWASARAALYPRISLTASGGTSTEDLDDLLDRDFRVWSLLGNLTQPIFQGGRLRAAEDRAEAVRRELLEIYAGAVLNAYGEVESYLAAEQYLKRQEAHVARAADQAEAAERLALDRYSSGLENYITVLEAQRRALTNRSTQLETRRLLLDNRVDLILALGGGFEVSSESGDFALAVTADTDSSDREKAQ